METPSIYAMALSNAKAELQSLKSKFDEIAKRKLKLEAFIANAEPLVEGGERLLRLTSPQIEEEDEGEKKPLWELIKLAINGKGNAFSVADAIQALDRIGKPVMSPNKVQIVRNALIKRTDTFSKLSPGVYAV